MVPSNIFTLRIPNFILSEKIRRLSTSTCSHRITGGLGFPPPRQPTCSLTRTLVRFSPNERSDSDETMPEPSKNNNRLRDPTPQSRRRHESSTDTKPSPPSHQLNSSYLSPPGNELPADYGINGSHDSHRRQTKGILDKAPKIQLSMLTLVEENRNSRRRGDDQPKRDTIRRHHQKREDQGGDNLNSKRNGYERMPSAHRPESRPYFGNSTSNGGSSSRPLAEEQGRVARESKAKRVEQNWDRDPVHFTIGPTQPLPLPHRYVPRFFRNANV